MKKGACSSFRLGSRLAGRAGVPDATGTALFQTTASERAGSRPLYGGQ
jgi:hypothetical protein